MEETHHGSARANGQMTLAWALAQQRVIGCGARYSSQHLPGVSPCETSLWRQPAAGTLPVHCSQSSLREKFDTFVMCYFVPKRPSELPMSLWVSCERLVSLFHPYAPTEVSRLGPVNLKQLITEWYKDHPAFAGLPFSAWCAQRVEIMWLSAPYALAGRALL